MGHVRPELRECGGSHRCTIRDAGVPHAIVTAYDDNCAVTSLSTINGGGKAEAQAAHIAPIAYSEPNVVQNGIVLPSTARWLFDRHLITIRED